MLRPPATSDELEEVETRSVAADVLASLTPRQRAAVVLTEALDYSARFLHIGFIHNGYGSSDVGIRLNFVREGAIAEDATAVTVAGHDGFYRRIDDGWEEWSVDVGGTTVFINLGVESGTSETDLADAHAIIRSIRTEPSDNYLGLRLFFTLTNDEWDSG